MTDAQKNALQAARDRLVRYLDGEEQKFWEREEDNGNGRTNRFVFGRVYPDAARRSRQDGLEQDYERGCNDTQNDCGGIS